MTKHRKRKTAWYAVLPAWFFMAAVLILLGVIIAMAINDLSRSRDNETQTLLEKSTVLIRTFESGARAGMGMGMRWRHDQRQTLLEETAYQPDILYIAITNLSGTILAHSDPTRIGSQLYAPQEMRQLNPEQTEQWRLITVTNAQDATQRAFEVYRLFKPSRRMPAPHRTHTMNAPRNASAPDAFRKNDAEKTPDEQLVIFTALDTSDLDAAAAKDMRNTTVFLTILFLLALASLLALFWARRYQRSNQQLEESKALSSEIVSHLPIGLITTDQQHHISVVNQAAERMLTTPQQALLNRAIHQALPAQWTTLVDHSQRQPMIEHEIEYMQPNGQSLPLSISVTKMVNEHGHFLGHLIIFRDMREIRQLQEQVRRKEKLAAMGNLAAGVAHEIRNPLSSIKGFANYFASRTTPGSEEHTLAGVMTKEVDRLNRTITELLNLVRPADVLIKPVNIVEVIEHALHLIRQDAENRQISLHFNHALDTTQIEIDPDRFTQVLLNLFLNAMEAIGSNGSLHVTATQHGNSELHVSVKDSGKGIRPEDLSQIFNPYFTTKATGTGLGLAIVQKVIEEHQGNIRVTSHPETGTQFDLTLPLTPPQRKPTASMQEMIDHENP